MSAELPAHTHGRPLAAAYLPKPFALGVLLTLVEHYGVPQL